MLRRRNRMPKPKKPVRRVLVRGRHQATLFPHRERVVGHVNTHRAFIEFRRNAEPYRDPIHRLSDWEEINNPPTARDPVDRKIQAARCMNCGTPFCQTHTGCPVNNLIPEWNELVYEDDWKEANRRLHKTNNFPEFTGRVCPAPCESACVAGLIDEPVTIKNIEYSIVDRAFEEGWIVPKPPSRRSGLRVAVVGSGPAGMAAADEINKKGHNVTVFERQDKIGGLLVYGIPNMKLDKRTVARRVSLLEAEGIEFVTGVSADAEELRSDFDAVVLCTGSTVPRDMDVPGRHLNGIHHAMEFLAKNQKRLFLSTVGTIHSGYDKSFVSAWGKNVVVIGGGDTGTDCIGTSLRHHCKSLVNFELMAQPPKTRAGMWPQFAKIYNVDYGHAESRALFGCDPRHYQVMTKEFRGDDAGNVKSIVTVDVEFDANGELSVRPNSEREWKCDLAILAMGFLHPEKELLEDLGVKLDGRRNVRANAEDYATSVDGIFAAGDCRRGQSLVVWAIREGRGAAEAVQKYFRLNGKVKPHVRTMTLNGMNGTNGMNGFH